LRKLDNLLRDDLHNRITHICKTEGRPRHLVVTEGGKIVWVSGQTGLVDEQGKSMAGDFEGQARVIFRNIDAVVKRAPEAA
jgi:enamine deaminase RidA (YjgF/YER057c/UK114 family)